MAAYFDTSAFDHLYKKIGCTAADIATLRKRIYGRELSILLSIHTLEEILLDRRARPELLVAKIKLTLSLGNFRRMVKPCDQLLIDDIRAYTQGDDAARPFIDAKLQNVISEGIAALVESDGEELDEDMIAALERVKQGKESLHDSLRTCGQPQEDAGAISFEEYFQRESSPILAALAQFAGALELCRERGFDGLLNVPSVRAIAGVTLAFAHARGLQGEPTGAALDLCHAPCAAATAEAFVSEDSHLREMLARVPLVNLEVIDLPGFLRK